MNEQNLIRKVMASDVFIGDNSLTHRIVGLEYINKNIECPRITLVVYQYRDIILAKYLAFRYGKIIYTDNDFSARLFRNYPEGEGSELIFYEDLCDAATIFSKFIKQTSKNQKEIF